jgi:hypothetical protein
MFRQLESFKLLKNLMPFWKSLAQLDVLIDGGKAGPDELDFIFVFFKHYRVRTLASKNSAADYLY